LKALHTPLNEAGVRSLVLGEEVSLSGVVYTARDEAHLRALEQAREGHHLPFEIKDMAIFHCGPIVEKDGGGWRLIAAGPTTSARMNDLEPEFIRRFRPRVIIGKGGMSKPTLDAMKECGCVYLAFTGGAAVVAAKGVKRVNNVFWSDLGMPEAVWELDLFEFGPTIVAMDASGHSLYSKVGEDISKNVQKIKGQR